MESTIVASSKLKELQGRLEKKRAEKSVIEMELREIKKKNRDLEIDIITLMEEIDKYRKKEGLTLSEHAIIRYLERVQLIPIGEIPEKVITPELKHMYTILGDGEFPIKDTTCTAVIKNSVIITIK